MVVVIVNNQNSIQNFPLAPLLCPKQIMKK